MVQSGSIVIFAHGIGGDRLDLIPAAWFSIVRDLEDEDYFCINIPKFRVRRNNFNYSSMNSGKNGYTIDIQTVYLFPNEFISPFSKVLFHPCI
jgi:hypothetical protein